MGDWAVDPAPEFFLELAKRLLATLSSSRRLIILDWSLDENRDEGTLLTSLPSGCLERSALLDFSNEVVVSGDCVKSSDGAEEVELVAFWS